MAGADQDESLQLLSQLLGKSITFQEPPSEENAAKHYDDAEYSSKDQERNETAEPELQEAVKKENEAPPTPAIPKSPDIDSNALHIGEPLDENVHFCTWDLVTAYPNNFIGKANKPLAQPFFDKILEVKTWDFFYLYHPAYPEKDPVLLVPTLQFEQFLRGINQALGINLTIPRGLRQRFCLEFGEGETPLPRYLKRVRDAKKLTIDEWPAISESDVEAFNAAEIGNRIRWTKTFEQTAWVGERGSDAAARRARKKLEARQAMLHRVQEYLGLRKPSVTRGPVVFVCIDIEAIEVAPNPVSEIGIAVLDTLDIAGIESVRVATSWWEHIKAHHLRTKQYAGLVNYRYVQGCPDAFNFGASVFPDKEELVSSVQAILREYVDQDRDLVLVGHDVHSDIKYLLQLGYSIQGVPGMMGDVDTQALHQAWKELTNGRSLSSTLVDLGIDYSNLHNAGNDAVYTLRAMLGIAVETASKGT